MQPPFFSWLNHIKPQHFCPCGTSPRPPEMVTPVIFAPFPRCELIEQAKGCFERVIYQVKWRFYGDVVGIKWDMYGDISYISNNTIHNIRVYGIYIYIHMYDRSIYFAFLGFSCLKTEKNIIYDNTVIRKYFEYVAMLSCGMTLGLASRIWESSTASSTAPLTERAKMETVRWTSMAKTWYFAGSQPAKMVIKHGELMMLMGLQTYTLW